jgi:hypothetical protein
MLVIPLQPIVSQTINSLINQQSTTLIVKQYTTGLFMDVYKDGTLITGGIICQNENRIIRDLYLPYQGDFAFGDTQPDPVTGLSDPFFQGLGTRFVLGYFFPGELPTLFGEPT